MNLIKLYIAVSANHQSASSESKSRSRFTKSFKVAVSMNGRLRIWAGLWAACSCLTPSASELRSAGKCTIVNVKDVFFSECVVCSENANWRTPEVTCYAVVLNTSCSSLFASHNMCSQIGDANDADIFGHAAGGYVAFA
jgi:hypothetical protein